MTQPPSDSSQVERLTARLAECERELVAARQASREGLEQSVRRSRFLAAACHDLRQPVHAMRLLSGLLGQQMLPTEATGVLRQMTGALSVLEDLFDDLLDAAQITERGVEPRWAPVPLQTLFDRVAVHVRPMAFDKGLDLRFRGGHHVVQADPVLLERMVRNLVVNAVRYTDDGGVLVGCRPRGDSLSLEVWDSGVGMTPDALAQIFEPYVQADGDTWRHRVLGEQGWGLGLAIVRMLAKAQGIALAVRSLPGRGSRFELSLRAASGQASRVIGADAPTAIARATLKDRRIAVSFGAANAADATMVCTWLTGWGAQVLTPADTQWADVAPDLLLADAIDTVKTLRARWSPEVPVVLIGNASEAAESLGHCRGLPGVPMPNRLRALVTFLLAGPTA